mgnify:CR=1 FL=1
MARFYGLSVLNDQVTFRVRAPASTPLEVTPLTPVNNKRDFEVFRVCAWKEQMNRLQAL